MSARSICESCSVSPLEAAAAATRKAVSTSRRPLARWCFTVCVARAASAARSLASLAAACDLATPSAGADAVPAACARCSVTYSSAPRSCSESSAPATGRASTTMLCAPWRSLSCRRRVATSVITSCAWACGELKAPLAPGGTAARYDERSVHSGSADASTWRAAAAPRTAERSYAKAPQQPDGHELTRQTHSSQPAHASRVPPSHSTRARRTQSGW
mmetsp:Transcript_24265/g.65134  ORF Transcript_24265/g.65134 Transcript_24265/m.65134 type:complete len:217 (+) Transcript_24265:371-1021(+)